MRCFVLVAHAGLQNSLFQEKRVFKSFITSVGLATLVGVGAMPTKPANASTHAKVLYRASWSHDASGWKTGGNTWNVHGGLLDFDGTDVSVFLAPYSTSTTRYAIEASIRLLAWKDSSVSENKGFGIVIRAVKASDPAAKTVGLVAGVGRGFMGCEGLYSQAVFATADTELNSLNKKNRAFRPGHGWHVYRVEVRDNTITLLIDGRVMNVATTSRYSSGKRIGLFSLASQLQVKSFTVSRI